MNAQVRVCFMGNRQVKLELEQCGIVFVPVICGRSVQQTPPTPGRFGFHDSIDSSGYWLTICLFSATSSALLHGLSTAWTQPCSSEMLPSSHSYTDSVFTACQLHAAGTQLKGVVKSHQWQLITCMETEPGDRGKGNRRLTPVWDTVTGLETFCPFQGPSHMWEATNMWMLSWMLSVCSCISQKM